MHQHAVSVAQPEDEESFTFATLPISLYAPLHWANPDLHFLYQDCNRKYSTFLSFVSHSSELLKLRE